MWPFSSKKAVQTNDLRELAAMASALSELVSRVDKMSTAVQAHETGINRIERKQNRDITQGNGPVAAEASLPVQTPLDLNKLGPGDDVPQGTQF